MLNVGMPRGPNRISPPSPMRRIAIWWVVGIAGWVAVNVALIKRWV